jgi:hypothetical protein
MFDLGSISHTAKTTKRESRTLVTAVPDRKKTDSNAKNTLQGCMACTTAVKKAVPIPSGVSDLRDHARYTSAAIAGTAIKGFIVQ